MDRDRRREAERLRRRRDREELQKEQQERKSNRSLVIAGLLVAFIGLMVFDLYYPHITGKYWNWFWGKVLLLLNKLYTTEWLAEFVIILLIGIPVIVFGAIAAKGIISTR